MIDKLFNEVVDSVLKKVNFAKLKEHQLKLIECLVQGKTVLEFSHSFFAFE